MASDIKAIKSSQKFMSDKYDQFVKEFKSLQAINSELKKDNQILASQVHELNLRVLNLEQKQMENDIEIVGLPDSPNEVLNNTITNIASKLGIEMQHKDIVKSFRVGNKLNNDKPRNIVVSFTNPGLKADLIKAARIKFRRNSSSDSNHRSFYINERLTKENKNLLFLAKQKVKEIGWKYNWTAGGNIYVRRDDKSRAIRL